MRCKKRSCKKYYSTCCCQSCRRSSKTRIVYKNFSNSSPAESSEDKAIKYLELYESERQFRDTFFAKETYTIFYAALICNILPFLLGHYQIVLDHGALFLFPGVGLVLTVYFWFLSIAYSARLDASGQSVKKILDQIPDNFRRMSVKETSQGRSGFADVRIAIWSPVCMFIGLLALNTTVVWILTKNVLEQTSNIPIIISCIITIPASIYAIIYAIKHILEDKKRSQKK